MTLLLKSNICLCALLVLSSLLPTVKGDEVRGMCTGSYQEPAANSGNGKTRPKPQTKCVEFAGKVCHHDEGRWGSSWCQVDEHNWGAECVPCSDKLTSTDEPISAEVKKLRQSSCTASNGVVSSTSPGLPSNPPNVRLVEAILPESTFTSLFPRAHASYTYDNFLKAVAKFPGVCTSEAICRKTLAVMFAHFQQETAGLVYLREINRGEYCARWSSWVVAAYPCSGGQKYYGRGAKQLSWNYNYGAFSTAMFGDTATLLDNPDLVADTWLNFASAFWFLVTPQPPKPSILQVIDGSWVPNSVDKSSGLVPGLGATTMVINGAMECGPSPPNQAGSSNRQNAYKELAAALDVDISGEKLACADMEPFNAGGAANPAIYWDHTQGCGLVRWQTAYSALVPGDYARCKATDK